jgi:hypothetical protein
LKNGKPGRALDDAIIPGLRSRPGMILAEFMQSESEGFVALTYDHWIMRPAAGPTNACYSLLMLRAKKSVPVVALCLASEGLAPSYLANTSSNPEAQRSLVLLKLANGYQALFSEF